MITITTTVRAPLSVVWEKWTTPADIMLWCSGHPDWHVPKAENDLRVGGKFLTRMEAKDGSMGFDFGGVYSVVEPMQRIEYGMDDARKVFITFTESPEGIVVREDFDAETENSEEMQRAGWQGILDNFKAHVEG